MDGEGRGRRPAPLADAIVARREPPLRAQGVAGVLDHHGPRRARQGGDLRQVADLAAQMDRQDGADGPLGAGQGLGQGLGRHQAAGRIDVGEDHLGADIAGAVGRRQEGDRGDHAGLARSDPQGQHGHVQGRRAVDAGHRVRRPHSFGEGRLEGLDPRTGGQEVVAQRLRHRSDVIGLDGLAAIGQEGRGHGQSVARRRRSGAPSWRRASSGSPVSHSSLVSLA